MPHPRTVAIDDIVAVIDLMKEGLTTEQAMDTLGLPYKLRTMQTNVTRYKRSHGIEVGKRGRPTVEGQKKYKSGWIPVQKRYLDVGRIHALTNAGWSVEKVADDLSTLPEYVEEILNNDKPISRQKED